MLTSFFRSDGHRGGRHLHQSRGRVSICEQKVTPPGTACRLDDRGRTGPAPRWRPGPDSPAAIRAELASVSAVHAGLTEDALAAAAIEGLLLAGGSIEAPPASGTAAPTNDAYSLRLVASRRMYDAGTMLQACPSSAGLAAAPTVRLHPSDFAKLGFDPGTEVKLSSSRGELYAPVTADPGVPVGSADPANAPGCNANALIDSSAVVTGLRSGMIVTGSALHRRLGRRPSRHPPQGRHCLCLSAASP